MSSPTQLTIDILCRKVNGFSKLKKGWDAYDAEPPSNLAIQNALTFLRHLEQNGIVPDWVEPSSDSSILLHITIDGRIHEWDFYNDGNIHSMIESIQ